MLRSPLIAATLVAAVPAPVAIAAGSWQVVAEARYPANRSVTAAVHAKIFDPRGVALRVVVRRNGRYLRAQVETLVRCGGWKRVTRFKAQTPVFRELRYQSYASRCFVDAGAFEVDQNSAAEIKLQILTRRAP